MVKKISIEVIQPNGNFYSVVLILITANTFYNINLFNCKKTKCMIL